MSLRLPTSIPEIPVRSMTAAVAYYENSLGFNLDWIEKDLGLAGISQGECRVFLASEQFRKGYGNVGPILTWLNLDSIQAVDELHRKWSESHAKIISAPKSQPWGLHEFTASDLDGNLFRIFYHFATPAREKSAKAQPS